MHYITLVLFYSIYLVLLVIEMKEIKAHCYLCHFGFWFIVTSSTS